MVHILVYHKVEDFDAWKKAFDEHGTAREAAGCGGGELYRGAEDPNDVVIRLSWDPVENARAFSSSDDAREAMARAGVVGQPTVVFLDEPESVER